MAAQTGQPVGIDDIRSDTRVVVPCVRESFRSAVFLPLKADDRVVGTISAFCSGQRTFTPADIGMMSIIGNVVGIAMANAQLYREQQRRAEELSALHQVGEAVSQSLDLEVIAEQALEITLKVLKLDAGIARVLNEDSQELSLLATRGLRGQAARDMRKAGSHVKLGQGLAGLTAQSGEPVVVEDLSQDHRLFFRSLAQGFESAAIIPLKVEGRVLGVISCLSRHRRTFTPRDLELMGDIGNMVGMAIANARLFEQVKALEKERELERMKDEFISIVSHELRTPLTSLHGAIGMLAAGYLGIISAKGQRMIEIAQSNTERLVRLINDVLDIQQLEASKATLPKSDCDAADLLTLAINEMGAMAEDAGITLSVVAQPAHLKANPDRIIQTLTNLLSNAIRFSPRGATVWVSAEGQGDEVLFTVRDQGQGIPTDKLGSIFGRFQQVDAPDSRKRGGTGLGLSICRLIVKQHGGRIWRRAP